MPQEPATKPSSLSDIHNMLGTDEPSSTSSPDTQADPTPQESKVKGQ
jgi:hypothetical protein